MNRVIVLTHKYFDGRVPDGSIDKLPDFSAKITTSLDQFNQRQGLEAYMEIARYWKQIFARYRPHGNSLRMTQNKQQVADCILTCLQIVQKIGLYGQIFLPETSQKIGEILNLKSFDDEIAAGHTIGESRLNYLKRLKTKSLICKLKN